MATASPNLSSNCAAGELSGIDGFSTLHVLLVNVAVTT